MEPSHSIRETTHLNDFSSTFTNGIVRESIEAPASTIQASHADSISQRDPQRNPVNDGECPENKNGFLTSPVDEDGYTSYDTSQIEPASSVAATEDQRIQAFAKLEFADGDFYMTTYAIELGRDRLTPSPPRDKHRRGPRDRSRIKSTSSAAGLDNNGEGSVRDSIEANGDIDGAEMPGNVYDDIVRREDMASSAPSSQQPSQRSSARRMRKDYNALASTPVRSLNFGLSGGSVDDFDPSTPSDCPLIPLQQPRKDRGRPLNKKSISRRHARISFNFDRHYFELKFIGRNGGFLDDEWFPCDEIQPLVNGSVIQIGGLSVKFILPDVPLGETGASEIEKGEYDNGSLDADNNQDAEDSNEGEVDNVEASKMTTRGRGISRPMPEETEAKGKRKGPGRPPKNGVMSKREQAQLAREAREKAKSTADRKAGNSTGRGKGKTAKALELEHSSIQPSGKRKYTKRKRANGENNDQNIRESTELTDSVPPEQAMPTKPPREKKAVKPPRSPSPVWDESTLTPEQLAKPQASYVILIHEALTNSETGAMSLPQIYRAIERKYPYFKLRVSTQGWQSSVRHNLGQHAAFRKIERDGKGWMWGYDPEVSIEKEKKRRATPPPSTNPQPRYYPQQQPRPNQYPYPGVQFPAGQMPPNGQLPSNGLSPMVYGQHPGMAHSPLPPRPPFAGPGFPMILNANSGSDYRSPYDPNSSTQQPPPIPSQSQPGPQPNGFYSSHGFPTPQPPSAPSHYPNFHPAPSNPSPTLNAVSKKSSPPTQSPPPTARSVSAHALVAINKFKTALMQDMANKDHAEKLIQSAINRALGVQPHYAIPKEDFENEKTIMDAVHRLLVDLGERDKDEEVSADAEGDKDKEAPEDAEAAGEARMNQMANNAAKVAAADAQTETLSANGLYGGDGTTISVLKHKRSSSAEADDEPPEKKMSV
ncbi:MAG: hypothetical protein Q9164_002106 [Protoblastenia rupestris]